MNNNSRILHLTLKKRWFDLILSGEKKEEYRTIKNYWKTRLMNKDGTCKNYDLVKFKNGYSRDAPVFLIECKGIRISTGIPEWGAVGNEKYFVITLGDILM